jgi:hypothetical protein
MQRILLIAATTLAACSATSTSTRVAVPPPSGVSLQLPQGQLPTRAIETAEVQPTADNPKTQAWLAGEVAERRAAETRGNLAPSSDSSLQPSDLLRQRGLRTTTDEEATKAWLQQTADERRAADTTNAPLPLQQTVYVDRPVYSDPYVAPYGYGYGYGYDGYGNPIYGYGSSCRQTNFPVNTVVGAGIGAIVGSGSRHQGRDIAVGAGIGLLLDFASW